MPDGPSSAEPGREQTSTVSSHKPCTCGAPVPCDPDCERFTRCSTCGTNTGHADEDCPHRAIEVHACGIASAPLRGRSWREVRAKMEDAGLARPRTKGRSDDE